MPQRVEETKEEKEKNDMTFQKQQLNFILKALILLETSKIGIKKSI